MLPTTSSNCFFKASSLSQTWIICCFVCLIESKPPREGYYAYVSGGYHYHVGRETVDEVIKLSGKEGIWKKDIPYDRYIDTKYSDIGFINIGNESQNQDWLKERELFKDSQRNPYAGARIVTNEDPDLIAYTIQTNKNRAATVFFDEKQRKTREETRKMEDERRAKKEKAEREANEKQKLRKFDQPQLEVVQQVTNLLK